MADENVVVSNTPVRRSVIPDLTDTTVSGLTQWAKKVIEAVGVLTGQVAKTDEALLDKAVTFRDLIESGLAVKAPVTSSRFIEPPDGALNGQAPPAPTGFTVTRLPYNMRLQWNAPAYSNHLLTEVWRNSVDNLSTAIKIAGVVAGANIYEDGYVQGQVWYYWIRFVSQALIPGGFNAISGTSDNSQPGDVTGLAFSFEGFAIRLRWNPVIAEDLDAYDVRLGATWDTAQHLDRVKSTFFLYPAQLAGVYRFWVRARDITGFYSGSASSIDVTISAPETTVGNFIIIGATYSLSWQIVVGTFAIDRFELLVGDVYATAAVLDRTYSTAYSAEVDWGGNRRFWIRAVDVAGNVGGAFQIDINILSPGQVSALTADVVDNNVLLKWSPPLSGTLPIETYEIWKGSTFAGAALIGDKSGLFTSVFEQAAGDYTYWVRPRDTAGNVGTPFGVTARVSQPPDYVLYSNLDLDLSTATLSSALLEVGNLVIPANPTETYGDHFSTRSWASPQDQIDAGYPIYIQPVPSSGYAEIEVDYGAAVPATTVVVTPTLQAIAGSPTYAIQISHKLNLGDSYSGPFVGESLFISGSFRYVKVRITVTSSGSGVGVFLLTTLNAKLNTKQKSFSSQGVCNSADSGGTRFILTADGTDISKTGNNTNGQDTITGIGSTANLAVGMSVEGPGIQGGTLIKSIDSSSQITLNKVTTAGSTGGTYLFGISMFVDLFGPPTIQPVGTTPIIPVVDFLDAANPLSFKVLLFNDSGTRVSADISWTARGV